MEYRRPVKPAHRTATVTPQQQPTQLSQVHTAPTKQSMSKGKIIAIALAILLFIGLIIGLIWWQGRNTVSAHIDNSRYQAVFFTNGQVYFGKLAVLSDGHYKLTDIYYLQSQDATEGDNPQETSEDGSSDVQLIKLGSEIHGPEDEMVMSKEQVLFFENLKTDGSVAESIQEYNSSRSE